ncbi:treslin [Protobothrops mucrosquamatus]|uniref:treslin n=1 Tax=Protobothrops mucrosquamatus TaxID=103944 RepID=UPI000775B078|nr:treslin [Protobothrops mucrosquamatus]
MTCSHNVVFLLDTADSTEKARLHLGTLRILNFLACKFGLAKVRWDFKFFDSMGIRGRASRVGSFRELGSRSWEDFEEELAARFGKQLCTPCSPGPTPRSTVTRNILKETLLDYQWDRPEIVSPAKPVLRSQKNKLTVIADNPPVQSTHAGFANAIFLLSPCPHSQRELLQFISGNYASLLEDLPPLHDLAEKFLPKGIQDMIVNHKVTLYWMDTAEWSKLEPSDHTGYLMLLEVMCILGGTVLSSEVAEVTFLSGAHSPCTGVLSPISGTATLLSLLSAEQVAEAERCLLQAPVAENISKELDFCLPEVVSSVLSQVIEDSDEDHHQAGPGWAQQELPGAQSWNPDVLEDWYSVSNLCGASSYLMEPFRMLQASCPQNEEDTPKSEVELRRSLAEFYQKKNSDRTVSSHPRDQKKRCGAPRTPIRQKMKTMPRSLQMLNVAMLNVKAQKHQPEGDLPANKKPRQRPLSRRLENGRKRKSKMDFSTEGEMLSYLSANYENAMKDGGNLFARSQDMVTAVNAFQKSSEAACLDTIQTSLLKTTNALRQQLASDPDKETKIKECQLQVYLRLEMCLQRPSLQNNTDRMEQLVQEMTELLRMLCLTKDPGYLSSFLEEVLDIYMESMPKTLGDLYYSLGTEIPSKLASVLPADFFSDDSITEETESSPFPASAASFPLSKAGSLSTEADELEELRSRSAKKRKHPLARHRSIAEMSQNLRQIEIPQASWNHKRKDSSHVPLEVKLAPISKKMGVQEVIKVRRNLFNRETLSLGKGSLPKMARSQSVSILEDLKHKRSRSKEDIKAHHKLLTTTVAETPLHKQMSRRLLQRQITGRCSDPGSDVGIVEESPEKTMTYGLRRSPRIKQLMQDKFLSSSIRSLEPNKRNTPQVHSAHLEEPVLCQKLDVSPLLHKPLSDSSPVDQGPKRPPSGIASAEEAADAQPALSSSPPRHDRASSLLAISKSGSCAYALRCTADRRQREAAARLEKEEKMATSQTLGATAAPLTYEVELEMQASGLPKLRIRKVASEAVQQQQQPPVSCDTLKGEENDRTAGDVSVAWCSRHPEKLELLSISPSCVRSAHNTPGKFGIAGQTYICHSYSPTLCASSTASPSQGSSGVAWTPSPKRNGKVTPEAIKDWPRRKRAAVGCNRNERPAEAVGEEPAPHPGGKEALELFGPRKAQPLGDPEFEGIDMLLDLGSDTEGNKEENLIMLGLESRKRALEPRSLGEEASQEMKRPCLIKENPRVAVYSTELLSTGEQTVSSKSTTLEDIFSFSDTTPPKSSGVISASGLWALEQSPLLYKGPPTSQRKCPNGEDSETFAAAYEDLSLFRSAPGRKRSITRTYSRKRPLC